MNGLNFWLGIAAAALTSLSYLPQVKKALPQGATKDLSYKTLIALTSGLVCWVAYGLLKQDFVIVTANAIGATLAGITLACKLRDMS